MIIHSGKYSIPLKKLFSYPLTLILILDITWLIIASIFSSMPLVSFKHTFIQIIYFTVFFILFFAYFDKPVNILKFYFFYALGLVIPILHGMAWHSQYGFNSQSSYYMPQPFFIEHTIYGAAIDFVIPVLFWLAIIPNEYNRGRIRRAGFILLFLLCLTAEFLSYSRAAWMSLMTVPIIVIIYYYRIRPVYLVSLLTVLIIAWVLNTGAIMGYIGRIEAKSNRGNLEEQVVSVANIQSDISNLERINRWKCAIRMFIAKPLRGFGPGTYQFQYGSFQVRSEMTRISTYHGEKGNAHSEYLGRLAESGFPGLAIYLAAIFWAIYTASRIIYRTCNRQTRTLAILILCSLIPFLIHTIFNGFLETDKIGPLYYGSLAAIAALDIHFFRASS
jgi:O-antigen ligase